MFKVHYEVEKHRYMTRNRQILLRFPFSSVIPTVIFT